MITKHSGNEKLLSSDLITKAFSRKLSVMLLLMVSYGSPYILLQNPLYIYLPLRTGSEQAPTSFVFTIASTNQTSIYNAQMHVCITKIIHCSCSDLHALTRSSTDETCYTNNLSRTNSNCTPDYYHLFIVTFLQHFDTRNTVKIQT